MLSLKSVVKCSECKPLVTVKVLEKKKVLHETEFVIGRFMLWFTKPLKPFLQGIGESCLGAPWPLVHAEKSHQCARPTAAGINAQSVLWRFLLWLNRDHQNMVASRTYVENQATNSIISYAFRLCLAKILIGYQPPHWLSLLNKWKNPVLTSHYFSHFICFRAFKLSTFSWGLRCEISWFYSVALLKLEHSVFSIIYLLLLSSTVVTFLQREIAQDSQSF